MALFINRWSKPLHVIVGPVGTGDLQVDEGRADLYRAADIASPITVCGMDLDAANSQGQRCRGMPHLLRVSEMELWEDLGAFLQDEDVCQPCLERLPDEWPPAARYVEAEPDVAVVSERLCNITGIDPARAEALYEAGYYDEDHVAEASQEELTRVPGANIGPALAARIKASVGEPEDESEPDGLGELFG